MTDQTTHLQGMASDLPKSGRKPLTRRQIIVAAALGNFIEFFDFTVFTVFVITIGQVFFPSEDPNADLLKALATFGVGFFMRPVGGVFFGYYADKLGRKPAMIATLSMMTFGTLMIACAPSYATAGVWGPIILVTARLLQGFAAGGEVGASTTIMVESAPANRRGLYSSWQFATQGAATLFGGLLATILYWLLDKEQMFDWGWRIPFAIGVLLGPIGVLLRLRIEEAIHSSQPKTEKTSSSTPRLNQAPSVNTTQLLRDYSRIITLGILLTIGSTITVFMCNYFYGNFAAKFLGIPQHFTSLSIMTAGFINLVLSPVAGYISDLYGRKPIIFYSRALLGLLAFPSYWVLVNWPDPVVLFIVVTVMVSLTTLSAAPSILIINESFPRQIRALAFSIVYSLAVAIFGGFAQFFALKLIDVTGSNLSPSLYLIAGCLLSVIVLRFMRDPYRDDLK